MLLKDAAGNAFTRESDYQKLEKVTVQANKVFTTITYTQDAFLPDGSTLFTKGTTQDNLVTADLLKRIDGMREVGEEPDITRQIITALQAKGYKGPVLGM